MTALAAKTLARRTVLAMVASATIGGHASAEDRGGQPDRPVAPKGRVEITEAARRRLERHLDALRAETAEASWVVGIVWSERRAIREKGQAEWRELGPGLEVGFYPSDRVPEAGVERFGGLPVVFVYPDGKFSAFDGKTIDHDGSVFVVRER